MASRYYVMNVVPRCDGNPPPKAKALYYEEKAVGSTSFYKCEACPYMALAEDDIKFHLFTVHPDLAKTNGLYDNIRIPCPGCTEVFDAADTLRTHLREHHKMGIRDVRKMVKSLVQIALKNIKKQELEDNTPERSIQLTPSSHLKIPQVIEIGPDILHSNNVMLPSGVTIISVDELQKMSTSNFEKLDPKEVIQEASINIVYNDELPIKDVTASESEVDNHTLHSSTPDLISSVQTSNPQAIYFNSADNSLNTNITDTSKDVSDCIYSGPVEKTQPFYSKKSGIKKLQNQTIKKKTNVQREKTTVNKNLATQCSLNNCGVSFVSEEKLAYHISCHHNSKLICPECKRIYTYVKDLHTHLWKMHEIDMELNTCNICDYKTYSLSRLNKIHKAVHKTEKHHPCPICGKMFKNSHHMIIHKSMVHKSLKTCSICMKNFKTQRQLNRHVESVHKQEKRYQCGECDYATSRKCTLKVHIRTHTDEETYKCEQCNFTCQNHNSFRKHKIQHSKQKTYNCKHCSYTSIQSRPFINHMMNHHPDIESDDIFPCPYCQFKSVSRDNFLSHLKRHNTENNGIQSFVVNNSQPSTNWMTPSKDQPKNIWNTPTQTEPLTNWNTPTQDEAMANWTSSTEDQPKTNWNVPTEIESTSTWNQPTENQHCDQTMKTDKIDLHACDQQNVHCTDGSETPSDINISIEVDDCDSEQDIINKTYPTNYSYIKTTGMTQENAFHIQEILTDLNKDDNNSDCIISESSNDTVNERHQCYAQHSVQNVRYVGSNMHGANLHNFLGTAVSTGNNLPQDSNANVITSNNSFTSNNLSTNIMSNFPIHLPHNPRLSIRTNLTLTPSDKIPLPVPKAIIKPIQILPIPSSSNSPVLQCTSNQQTNQFMESEGAPKKKAKISVKSNLILKGPDQINMFNSEQNMVFARLQDNERLNLSSPVTFNNLITTCMQLPPEPVLSNNPEELGTIPPYTPEPMLGDTNIPQVKDNRPLFTFNRQIDMNSINIFSQEHSKMSIICGNPSFIKLESKQNIQSPSLERMCNAESIIKTQEIPDEYCKASALLEDMQKNVNDIKNEIKSDTYFNMTMNSSQNSPNVIDRHLMDVIIGANEVYGGHLDLTGVVLPESDDDQEPDIIEIDDDNSEDNKIIPQRYDMSYPLEYIHNDFCFLENDLIPYSSGKSMPVEPVSDMNKMATEVPLLNQNKEITGSHSENQGNRFENFIHSRTDPMMNTFVRPTVNKINVKNIESMKN